MEKLILTNHEAIGSRYRIFDFSNQVFSQEYKSEIISFKGVYYEEIHKVIIAIFSNLGKNYLFLENKLLELTRDVSINYFCGEELQKSWIKIFQKEELIFRLEYINPTQTPFKDFFLEFEDWDVINFAYHLAQYIQKVKDHPGIVLFENAENG
jgi:hypothetical protein